MGHLDEELMNAVNDAISISFGLSHPHPATAVAVIETEQSSTVVVSTGMS